MSNFTTVQAFIRAGGLTTRTPTIAEVAVELRTSESTARRWLDMCVREGLMEKKRGEARCYSLTERGKNILYRETR